MPEVGYAHFLSIAKASLMETETLLLIASQVGQLDEEQVSPLLADIVELSKMIEIAAIIHRRK